MNGWIVVLSCTIDDFVIKHTPTRSSAEELAKKIYANVEQFEVSVARLYGIEPSQPVTVKMIELRGGNVVAVENVPGVWAEDELVV